MTQVECGICLDTKDASEFHELASCKHSFCQQCVSQLVGIKVASREWPTCPLCHVKFVNEEMLSFTTLPELSLVQQPNQVTAIPLTRGQERQYRKTARKLHLKKCPHCQAPIQKNGGCNHMTCHCGQSFSWSQAENLVPCNQLHWAEGGKLKQLWGRTCKGCTCQATAKLILHRSALVLFLGPFAAALSVVAGVVVVATYIPKQIVRRTRKRLARQWQHYSPKPTVEKITFVGDWGVGKTSFLLTLTNGVFPDGFVHFDTSSLTVPFRGTHRDVTLWDTPSHEDFERLRPLSYLQTSLFVVAFAVDNRNSFNNISNKWLPELNHYCPGTPVVLLATKTDLWEEEEATESEHKNRFVTREMALALVEQQGMILYLETSARQNVGLEDFYDSVLAAAEPEPTRPPLLLRAAATLCCLS